MHCAANSASEVVTTFSIASIPNRTIPPPAPNQGKKPECAIDTLGRTDPTRKSPRASTAAARMTSVAPAPGHRQFLFRRFAIDTTEKVARTARAKAVSAANDERLAMADVRIIVM